MADAERGGRGNEGTDPEEDPFLIVFGDEEYEQYG